MRETTSLQSMPGVLNIKTAPAPENFVNIESAMTDKYVLHAVWTFLVGGPCSLGAGGPRLERVRLRILLLTLVEIFVVEILNF
mgnify:CR=1 FL=1